MKILLAAPTAWATDALCGLLRKLIPGHELQLVPNAQSLLHSDQARADLLLLDIDGAVPNVAASISELSRSRSYDRIVVMGTPLDNIFVELVLAAGALGYLPKSYSETVTVGVLRLILDGMNSPTKGLPPAEHAAPIVQTAGDAAESLMEFGLSRRQTDVLALATEGKSNHSIAAHLGIGEGTVKLHMSAVFKALKVRNRSEAVLFASRSKSINFRQIREAEGGRLDLDWLLGHMTHQHLARDTVVFSKGDPGRELYILAEGKSAAAGNRRRSRGGNDVRRNWNIFTDTRTHLLRRVHFRSRSFPANSRRGQAAVPSASAVRALRRSPDRATADG